MKNLFIISLLFLSSLLSGQVALQVVTEEWEPYNFTENGELTGISTEIVKTTIERAGLTPIFNVYPWSRAYYKAINTPDTLIYTIYRNEERENKFFWIGPINSAPRHFLYKLKSRDDINLSTVQDARNYTIGLLANNYAHQKLLEEGFHETNLVINRSADLSIQMLLAGRIDLFPGDQIATSLELKKLNIPEGTIVPELQIFETEAMAYMALNRQSSPVLIERITRAFEEVRAEGLIEEITAQYNSSP
ncbi:MAG: transporter substrate-binding domain-containing protein [Spirochaetales bacterium]|nr:transporter substrate-binding domain-containing protein [Spirochaetales bacterium]